MNNHKPQRIKEFKEVRKNQIDECKENELKQNKGLSIVQENTNTRSNESRKVIQDLNWNPTKIQKYCRELKLK